MNEKACEACEFYKAYWFTHAVKAGIDTKCDNANAIKEFLSVLDGIQHPERRKVYVIVDDKMLAITSARLTENNRIVFGTKYAFEVPYLDSLPGSDQSYLSRLCNLKL